MTDKRNTGDERAGGTTDELVRGVATEEQELEAAEDLDDEDINDEDDSTF